MQRRVRCDAEPAKVLLSGEDEPLSTTIGCGRDVVAIVRLRVSTLDEAITEVQQSMRTLQSWQLSEVRAATTYRVDHRNTSGYGKQNYWIDQVTKIDGHYYICQASGMATSERDGDPADAERGAAICKSLE